MAAYGLGDAEHLVEKEIARRWPGARVQVVDVGRPDDASRIVEELTVSFRLDATVEVEAESAQAAPATAFRQARGLLAGSRYHRTAWEAAGPVVPLVP